MRWWSMNISEAINFAKQEMPSLHPFSISFLLLIFAFVFVSFSNHFLSSFSMAMKQWKPVPETETDRTKW